MPDPPTPWQVFWRTLRQAWRTDPTYVVCAAVAVVCVVCVTSVGALALLLRIVERWRGCV